MKIIRSIIAAFALYSHIPMPRLKENDGDITHVIPALPLVGVVIGAIEYGLFIASRYVNLPAFVRMVLFMIVPIAVTGGFHIDGFLDTEDAIKSYRDRERKLEIMKDPNVGSFAITGLITAGLFMAGSIYLISDNSSCMIVFSLIFVISRVFTALTSIFIKKADEEDMLAVEVAGIRKTDVFILLMFLIASVFVCCTVSIKYTFAVMLAFFVYTLIYAVKMIREFGGIVGDTAGYFVVVSEVFATCVLAVVYYVGKFI
ncbi:MAG: adenosylcobinamide-GDP ribazoletransferase [Lachnospiraceae bacterium]|nr:adenosylcobinamide-GDP ribazoletransferase [Lachnospiraceae bacterium]